MITIRKYDTGGRELIRKYLAPCRLVVDLGCNAEKIRPDAVGYDLFPEFGLITDFNRDGLDKVFPGFDGICLSHVMEHIIDVRRFLRACFERLPAAGRIAIACPDGEDAPAATLGDASLTHEMLFTAKTLALYLEHAGFSQVQALYYQRPYASRQARGIFAAGEKA
jgi:hypothetical protein